jgi:glycosyltransferase involved in cell wall biosynthesis
MIAVNVGGIPEIFGPFADGLVRPNDADALAAAIGAALDDPGGAEQRAKTLRERVFLHFSQRAMVDGVLAGYRDAFAEH